MEDTKFKHAEARRAVLDEPILEALVKKGAMTRYRISKEVNSIVPVEFNTCYLHVGLLENKGYVFGINTPGRKSGHVNKLYSITSEGIDHLSWLQLKRMERGKPGIVKSLGDTLAAYENLAEEIGIYNGLLILAEEQKKPLRHIEIAIKGLQEKKYLSVSETKARINKFLSEGKCKPGRHAPRSRVNAGISEFLDDFYCQLYGNDSENNNKLIELSC